MGGWTLAITLAALACGLNADVFLAFSTFVMSGLRQLPAPAGLAAMQSINRAAPASRTFMVTLLGTAVLVIVVLVVGLVRADPAWPWLALGAAAYLIAIVLTVACHVPRNNALDGLDPDAPTSTAAWQTYAQDWTRANHARTATCALACAAFVQAAVVSAA